MRQRVEHHNALGKNNVLDRATKGIEVENIEVRVSELERTVTAGGRNR